MAAQINVIVEDAKFNTLTRSASYIGVSRSRYLATLLSIHFQGADETVVPSPVANPYDRHAIVLPEGVKRDLEDRCAVLNCTYSEYLNGFLTQ